MTKVATLSSLLRVAARTEAEFVEVVQSMIDANDHERTAEFFDKMNIPRSVPGELTVEPVTVIAMPEDGIGDYEQERAIGLGIQKYMDRHERKIKWHAGHPSMEGVSNVVFVMRCASTVTNLRLERLHLLLNSKDELTVREWFISREMMNKSFLSYRNHLRLVAGPWTDAMNLTVDPMEFSDRLETFYEIIDGQVRKLEEHRKLIEERRVELTVTPEGFPPVKPPNYFGGDLMGVGPWSQYWTNVVARAHHFRESVG
jgi:hypothetical protein